MIDRNRRIKPRPERFQACFDKFDVVFTLEERVYDQVIEGTFHLTHPRPVINQSFFFVELASRPATDNTPVHVINVDIQDNHEEATIGSFLILDLVNMLSASSDLDNDIDEILQEFESKTERTVLHTVFFQ